MINTTELEKRWYRYKTKGVVLVFSILTVIVALIYGGYYILYKLDLNISFGEPKSREPSVMGITKIVEEESNNTEVERNTTVVEEKQELEDVILAPIIPIVDLEREKIKERERIAKINRVKDIKIAKERERVKERERLVQAKENTYLTSKRETKKINLNITSNNYMTIMKKKFEQDKNPREALLIARAYYKAGNYTESEKWALIANNLDKKLDESWLIFASSQEKLGKRQEALKILVAYYRTSKSAKAKALIYKIKTKSL